MKILKLAIENFKGIKSLEVDFSDSTTISGRNASGKTTVLDAVCWLLFNTDSHGNTKFDVRPLDKDGKMIDNVEIKVVGTFDIDGKNVELSKVQKQKWTKHRGQEQAKFEGNVNSYEVGGYPKSEKDYSEYISSIVDADVFKMLTSPTYFTSMPWKDQREVLMRFVSDMSDVELANSNAEFAPLVMDIENAPTLDDIGKKYGKVVKELKARQTEIPVRIDEVAKQKVDLDAAELELEKNAILELIAKDEQAIKSGDNKAKIDDIESDRLELQFKINDRKRALLEGYNKDKMQAEDVLADAKLAHKRMANNIEDKHAIIDSKKIRLKMEEEERSSLGEKYKAIESEMFEGVNKFNPDDWAKAPETVCHVCGQPLPEDKAKTILAEWEERKANAKKSADDAYNAERNAFLTDKKNRLEALKSRGFELKNEGAELEAEIKSLEAEVSDMDTELATLVCRVEDAEKALTALGSEPDISLDKEYADLISQDADMLKQIEDLRDNAPDMSELEKQKAEHEKALEAVNAKLAQFANNASIDERIAELESEQTVVAQKIADAERMLYLFEKFMRAKLDRVSDAVNSHFKVVKFKLFDFLINGGIKECCEVTYDGISYSTLNSGHRLVAGYDIINALSELYKVSCPIFTDNAESLNDFNIPKMEQQMILLKVSDEDKLTVRSNG